jgi:hypothetical protein
MPRLARFKFGLMVAALWAASAQAATFTFSYADVTAANGIGFDDAGQGALRRATLEDVANNYLGSTILGSYTGNVGITVNVSQTDGTGFLASAGSSYFLVNNSFQTGLVQTRIIGGGAGGSQGSATFDFGYNWAYGPGAPGVGNFDFRSVALHELTHALGFASLISGGSVAPRVNNLGQSQFFSSVTPPTSTNTFTNFDSFLRGSNSGTAGLGYQALISGGNGVGGGAPNNNNGVFDTAALTNTVNRVTFNGANAIAANGGNAVLMNTPGAFDAGSSISHLDNSFANDVMLSAIGSNQQRRTYSAVDIAILQDLGYTLAGVSPVPEPSHVLAVCLLVGFAGYTLRRRFAAAA